MVHKSNSSAMAFRLAQCSSFFQAGLVWGPRLCEHDRWSFCWWVGICSAFEFVSREHCTPRVAGEEPLVDHIYHWYLWITFKPQFPKRKAGAGGSLETFTHSAASELLLLWQNSMQLIVPLPLGWEDWSFSSITAEEPIKDNTLVQWLRPISLSWPIFLLNRN